MPVLGITISSTNIFCRFLNPKYTGLLAPADFSGAVFTCAHFQKIAQISSLCDFHYKTWEIVTLKFLALIMVLL